MSQLAVIKPLRFAGSALTLYASFCVLGRKIPFHVVKNTPLEILFEFLFDLAMLYLAALIVALYRYKRGFGLGLT